MAIFGALVPLLAGVSMRTRQMFLAWNALARPPQLPPQTLVLSVSFLPSRTHSMARWCRHRRGTPSTGRCRGTRAVRTACVTAATSLRAATSGSGTTCLARRAFGWVLISFPSFPNPVPNNCPTLPPRPPGPLPSPIFFGRRAVFAGLLYRVRDLRQQAPDGMDPRAGEQ